MNRKVIKSSNNWEEQTRASNGQFGQKKGTAAISTTLSQDKGVSSAQCLHKNNISFLDNTQEFKDVKTKLKTLENDLEKNEYTPSEYLEKLKTCFNASDISKTVYALKNFGNDIGKLRISDHESVIKNKQGKKTLNTSIVIQLKVQHGRRKNARIIEYIYSPQSFSKEEQKDILNGIKDWLENGTFTGTKYKMTKSFIYSNELKHSYSQQVNALYKALLKNIKG